MEMCRPNLKDLDVDVYSADWHDLCYQDLMVSGIKQGKRKGF